MTKLATDFNIYKSLWSNINDVCAPPPPPGQPAKSCFLMEMPGFSIDPDAFDPDKFNPGIRMSPDCATALLCDRIPALAQYFYDTGNHISFYWHILLTTYGTTGTPAQSEAQKKAYETAIEMLYGSMEGYKKQEKTELFKNVDVLRNAWEKAQQAVTDFKTKCQKDKKNWPGNYEKGAGPLMDAARQAYVEYDTLKMQIQRYESEIYSFATGNLDTLMLEQAASKL